MTDPAAAGLSSAQAQRRLAQFGPNVIARQQAASARSVFASQFKSPVIWLLLAACVVSGGLGELVDAIAIGTIVLINALVGFFQEYRAQKSVLALRSMTAPRARVLRDAASTLLPAAQVVPGDVLLLEAGDMVAADARVLEAHALTTQEAALTGESAPVEKSSRPSPADAPLAERHDCLFMGTAVATGSGRAEVAVTGMATELGKIAHMLDTARPGPTPLQLRLAHVSQLLLYLCLSIVALVALLGLARDRGLFEVFFSAVSLAVAAVPEGLPAIVTIALAVGVQRMVARHVLVRHLPAVETLGCATVICTDKTGTLTTGVMTVRELWGADTAALIDAAAACCDAELTENGQTGIGDPTEVAILRKAAERGIERGAIERARPRVAVHPFDAERKRMSILRSDGVLYVKGALEAILPNCSAGTEGASGASAELAARGLRLLAVATGTGPEEAALRLLGVLGIADPPRSEAIAAVAAARRAGIQTIMITGDHPATARAIALELGILEPGQAATEVVHARATPADKLEIVRAWKRRGAVVAMTGDGVNDAPALREAHIGICMGKTGTEVAREASAMVLTDDNFASIVAAIHEGRAIFDNIRKALVYLLSGNAGELLVMLLASAIGLPSPLLPLHLLWINLITDGLPALALVMDPADPAVMSRPPRAPGEAMLGRAEWVMIAATALLQTLVTLGIFSWGLSNRNLGQARNLAFSVLVFEELLRSFAARSRTRLFLEVGALGNPLLLVVVGLSMSVQFAIHQFPITQALFQIEALSARDCALCVALALVPVSALELSKLARRALRRARRTTQP